MADLFSELMESIDSLTDEQINQLMAKLDVKRSGSQKSGDVSEITEIPLACPHCGSISIMKHGKKSGHQRYKCKDCNKTFTETHGTMLAHSRLTPAQWRCVLLGLVQNLSVRRIADMAEISHVTVWVAKQKVCMALKEIFGEQDHFVDIVECDECFAPVSFKGKRDPAFFIYTLGRMPRHNRTYEEKVYYLKKYGFWDDLQKNSARLEMLLSPPKKHKQGVSNEQTCILTCKDRSGNLYVNPVCIGRLGIADVKKNLTGRFASDAVMVTDSHNAYPAFARDEQIHLEQIEADKHTNGAFNLSRINSTHSKLKAYWSKERGRQPATKYMDLSLMLFWWLEKNGTLSTAEKVDKLGEIMSAKMDTSGTDYESITNREMTLNTKGLFPNKV